MNETKEMKNVAGEIISRAADLQMIVGNGEPLNGSRPGPQPIDLVARLERIKELAHGIRSRGTGPESGACLDETHGLRQECLNSLARLHILFSDIDRHRPTDDELLHLGIVAETLAFRVQKYFGRIAMSRVNNTPHPNPLPPGEGGRAEEGQLREATNDAA